MRKDLGWATAAALASLVFLAATVDYSRSPAEDAAMLLRYSLNMVRDADRVEAAVLRVLEAGHRTRDIAAGGGKTVGTREMGDLIVGELERGR